VSDRICPEPPNEERVFLNPFDVTTYDSVAGPRYQVREKSMDGAKNTFNASEWDVTVTFTPKRPVIKVGDIVKHIDYGFAWRVLYIHDVWAWVVPLTTGTLTPNTRLLRDLRPAD